MRKTRAQQVSYSDKLLRLQAEFSVALELALNVETRETSKIEANTLAQEVWSQRLLMVDLKRKSSALGTKEDEELFFDKERAIKKPKPDLPYVLTSIQRLFQCSRPLPVVPSPSGQVLRPLPRPRPLNHPSDLVNALLRSKRTSSVILQGKKRRTRTGKMALT